MPDRTPGPDAREPVAVKASAADGETRARSALSLEQLLEDVYPQLRALAGHLMRNEREEHTLQPTALVHEAVLRLLEQESVSYNNSRHLIAIAASAMRRALVDHARRRRSTKRDGGVRVQLSDDLPAAADRDLDLIAVDTALERLAAMDPRQARIVELRYYAGLDIDETAAALDISPATVKRDWVLAKAWLQREIGP
ncbi:MAG: sigma-70 family RNA polymerase sigma factor [Gemmatimonadaceae bacterium]|nr:sigma-70 family RNA polymerase sigma factor [Gemmatimonadaceae bacterium]